MHASMKTIFSHGLKHILICITDLYNVVQNHLHALPNVFKTLSRKTPSEYSSQSKYMQCDLKRNQTTCSPICNQRLESDSKRHKHQEDLTGEPITTCMSILILRFYVSCVQFANELNATTLFLSFPKDSNQYPHSCLIIRNAMYTGHIAGRE